MPSAQSKISKYVWLYIALIVAMMAVVKVSTVETAMKAEHRLVTSALVRQVPITFTVMLLIGTEP